MKYPKDIIHTNYKGNVLDKSYFLIDKMDSEELEKFEKWYEKKKQSEYVLKDEVADKIS